MNRTNQIACTVTFFLIGLIYRADAQTINITGSVVDSAANLPVSGAIVKVVELPLIADTTGTNGGFTLTGYATGSLLPGGLINAAPSITLKGDILGITNTEPNALIRVDIFAANGKRTYHSEKPADRNGAVEFRGLWRDAGFHIVTIRTANREYILKGVGMDLASSISNLSDEAALRKTTAAYNLNITAAGFTSKQVPLTVTSGTVGTIKLARTQSSNHPLLLSADPTKRFLVDGSGKPYLVWGESAWNLGLQLKPPAQNIYLDDRKVKGINAIQMMALSRYHDNSPNDADGVAPFTTPGDFATFNPAYFNKLADVVSRAAARGMVVFLAPCWAGYDQSQGHYDMMVSNGATKCRNYGAAIAAIFEPFDNIVWIMGGDKPGAFSTTEIAAMADGVRSVDKRHLVTAHWNFSPTDAHPGPWEDIAGCYDWAGGTVYTQVRNEYNENDAPVVTLESLYELNTQYGATLRILRNQEIMSMLMGAKGYFVGHEWIWHFGSNNPNVPSQSRGLTQDYNSPGVRHYLAIGSVFSSRAWHLLVPDAQGSTLVTAGRGSYGNLSYVGAAVTPDGKLAIIYVPDGGSITVAMTKFTGQISAKWYDPTTGTSKNAAGSPYANTGTHNFIASSEAGNNGAGEPDWLLVLEAQ